MVLRRCYDGVRRGWADCLSRRSSLLYTPDGLMWSASSSKVKDKTAEILHMHAFRNSVGLSSRMQKTSDSSGGCSDTSF